MAEEHISPDGRWRWNGVEWVPREQEQAREPEPAPHPAPEPEPSPAGEAPLGTFDEEMRGALRMGRRHVAAGDGQQVPSSMRSDVLARLRRPVKGQRRIAVISRKGGVGKTSTTLMLGHVLGYARGDRVLALDANPDAGSLAHRVTRETELSVNDVLRQPRLVDSYVEMRRFTSQAPSRLEVLASDQDPLLSEGLGYEEYARVMSVLRLHYGIVLCDTGTGVLDASTRGILALADQVVICTAAALDAYRAALRTLDWLEQHGHGGLARAGVVVVNAVQSGTSVDVTTMESELAGRCRAVVRVPWDEKLWAGAETTFEELGDATQRAYVRIAEAVVEGFDTPPAGRRADAPAALLPASATGPGGIALTVEVIPWRGATALIGRDAGGGRDFALEFPRVVRGGRDVDGRWLLVHRTHAGDMTARVARTSHGERVVLEAPGIAEDSPVYLRDARAGRRDVRVVLTAKPARILGVDVTESPDYRPTRNAPEVEETDMRLSAATVVTDERGTPVAVDLPAIPDAWTLTL